MTSFSLEESVNCEKMNPTRAGKHQFSLASCLQSRFCWSTGREGTNKKQQQKSKMERQMQGERKAFVWKYVRKGGDTSVLFCWEISCMFSCPLTSPSTPQNSARYLLISWESKNRLSTAANQELLFSWCSFHWELEWRALDLPPYRANSGLGAAQLA